MPWAEQLDTKLIKDQSKLWWLSVIPGWSLAVVTSPLGINGHSIMCMVTTGLGPGAAEIRMARLISRVVIRF